MKILHVIDSGGLYGAEVMLLSLMEEQVRLGLEPVLASIGDHGVGDKALEIEARRRGLSVQPFRMAPGPNLAGAFQMLRFARCSGVDLLHCHGYKGNILFGFLPAPVRRLPLVTTVHGWTWTGGASRMMLYEWLDGLSLARMDRVVLVNEAMREHPRLRNHPASRVEVVTNGIGRPPLNDQSAALNPAIVDFCRKGVVIGAIGRLSREKGFDLLLEAVAHLVREGRDLRLVLLGEGGLRGELEQLARDLALGERVLMPGYLGDARRYLGSFHLFAIPSLTEGLPIVLLEAMQAGVPIVSSAVGGIPAVLGVGEYGLLVEPGDPQTLARGIEQVLDGPAAAADRAQEAQRVVASRYSSEAMARKYLEVYMRTKG